MKKSISLLLVLALIVAIFALVGCREEEIEEEDDALSVCVVVAGEFGDSAFNDSVQEGAGELEEDGVDVTYIECHNEEVKQNLMNAAENADIVVAVGWECYDIADVAPEYLDTKFIWVDNVAEGIDDLDNVLCITYAENEGSFLAGYIAAKTSETGVIGAVGGEDETVVNDFITGYTQGARYADKNIEVEVIYAGDYDDPELGRECALTLAGNNADVIFSIAGNTGSGILDAAREGGFYVIGADIDQKIANPDYDDVIICSMMKMIGQSVCDVISDYIDDGEWEGARVWETNMASGYISIAYGDAESEQLISDEVKSEVNDIAAKIIAGEIEVDTTRK